MYVRVWTTHVQACIFECVWEVTSLGKAHADNENEHG